MEDPTGDDISAQAQRFIEGVDALLVATFGPPTEESHVHIVLGLNVGDALVLSTNLAPCALGEAIHDLHDMAAEQHTAYHAEDGPAPYMNMTLDAVPEEVRQHALKIAEENGIDPNDILFRGAVNAEDLSNDDAIAAFVAGGSDEPGERPVLTGDDDVAQPHETAKDIRDLGILGDLGDDENEV